MEYLIRGGGDKNENIAKYDKRYKKHISYKR